MYWGSCVQLGECAPEGAGKLAKAGTATGLIGPAAGKQRVDDGWAELRFVESNARFQLGDHLPVLQPEERLLGH